MGIRYWLGRALTLVLLGALLSAPLAGTAPAVAVARTGTIVVTIKTPAGVPGDVRLTSHGRAKVVRKAAAGTTVTVRLTVPVGGWRVSPRQIATSAALYAGSSTRSVVRVRAGRTSAVTVTYQKMTSAGTLELTINTPAGVPGTVRLQSAGATRMAVKPPAGTSEVVRLSVPP